MARYQVILAYDGTGFTGSQVQANSRTVQGELERALRNLGWSDRTVIMAGRTDTGVHATGQVPHSILNGRIRQINCSARSTRTFHLILL